MITFDCNDSTCENLNCESTTRSVEISCKSGAVFYACFDCGCQAFKEGYIIDANGNVAECVYQIRKMEN